MGIKNKNIADFYPLSPMQQGILFHSIAASQSDVYFEQFSWTITGNFNIEAFQQAWEYVVQRHAILRTCFVWEGLKEPVQVVHQQVTLPWVLHDWRHLSSVEQQEQLAAFLASDRAVGFELTRSPLMRWTLHHLSENLYQLTWSHHHILLDGWSVAIIYKEVFDCYKAFDIGQDISLEPVRSYRDYIVWLQQQNLSHVEVFWQELLKGFTTPTQIYLEKNSRLLPSDKDGNYHQEIKISAEKTAALQLLVRQQQLTLNTIIQGAWALLLSRYSSQEDVVFGATVSGRPPTLAKADSMVGLFINTLPVRVQISPKESFLSWLEHIQNQQIETRQYEFSPLMKVQGWSEIPKGLPLFETIIVFENYPVDASIKQLDINLKIETFSNFEKTNYPLTLVVNPGEELLLKIIYDGERFNAATISRMLGHFQTLLESIVAHPNQKLTDLAILTEVERHQLLVEWNHTQVNYPQDQCIHQLFEAQVELTPDAIAVVFEQEQLTYRQLNTKANQLAQYLKTLGVKPEVLVGICLERSLEMVIAILAILKAGGAYVPLDPTYPKERLAFILQDTQIAVLLTQQQLMTVLPEYPTEIVCLDRDWEAIAQHSPDNLHSGSTVDNLAYVIYTSGSTGQPKGVLIEHRNVTRLFDAVQSWFNFNSEDVWTLFHSIAFDFSVWELWGALLYGGRLVIVPHWLTRSPEAFYNLLSEQQVTVLNQTPSAFRQLIALEESLETTEQLALRLVMFGGEALEIHSLKPWFERHGDQFPQLVNMYGITETTVHVTYRPLTMDDLNQGLGSVIGRRIPDLQIYLLDQHQQPVPVGVPGEMYIGGAGLARGYLHRPELTQEKFIPHPFSNQANARLYRSGDQARYLPNGDIEYLGRIDQQVKIRGFRIELGEIETMLAQHPAVRETVVLARTDNTGNQQLIAYVVPSHQQTPTISQLRNFLKQQLPEYMLPAFFIILAALPLTSNGKVDRQSLPNPDTTRPKLDEAFVAPRTTPEKILAEIWAEILGLEQVGIYDNFFTLGGDSIRSIQVRSQAEKRDLYFSLPQLFKYQTIHELVQNITKNEADTTITKEVPTFSLICEQDRLNLPDDIEDAYPLTQLQMGMLFHSEYSLDTPTYHNVSSYHLQAPFNLQYFQVAVQQLASRHPVLRTSFELSKFTEQLQLVHQVVTIPLQVEDIRHLSFVEQEKVLSNWLETEKRSLFDWTKAPLLRFYIHRRSEKTFQFTLSFHHAIVDGWSVASMLTELFLQYLSLLNQEVDLLPESPTASFKDFVALEKEAIASEVQQRYWMEKLRDSSQTMLPRLPRTSQKDSGSLEVPISPAVSQGLLQLAQFVKVPVKSVLLAAHLRVLSLLSGQSDIVTGLVTNGRPEVTDGERVLGLFLNSLPFRLQFPGATWIDLVKNVFETEQELLPYRRYPLAQLQRVLGRQSLFETAFNFVHFHVYENALNLQDIQVLDTKTFGKTNFTFTALFSQDPFSSQVYFSIDYDPTVLGEEQIKQIGDYYTRTLNAIAFQPESRYETYSLLSEEEQHQLLVEWNNTKTDYPQDKCIHQLFEAQVELTPNAIAVVFADQQLTYNELNARVNKLAHHLQTLGVEPDVLVGIYLERSVEMIIAILSILKAGGAYVPLDPSYPQERLEFILQDTQLTVLLTQEALREKLPQHQAQVVCLDTSSSTISQQSQQNPVIRVKVENLAYVIYTSGSTGQPKGVEITHQNLVHSTSDRLLYYSEPITNFLLLSPFIFDSSVAGIFWTLCQGGALILPQTELQLQLIQLIELISQHQISHTLCLPSFYKLILEQAKPQQLVSLRTVIVAGESCSPELVQLHYQLLPHTSLFNEYGPTEGTVWSSVYNCQNYHNQTNVPIGRPLANTEVYILDHHLQPVPIGVPGELYIGGDGLARGYLNRPELTQEKFIPNPLFEAKSQRLYKTGDLARYLPDGNIEYIGRIDQQVKIRGFRIELGEIEAVLNSHPYIQQAVVIATEDIKSNKRLVAYVIPRDQSLTINELRAFLKQKLPEYMVPSAFVTLESLPLTPNGKIDRKSLPTPDSTINRESEYIAPRTPTEEIIANIFAQVLAVQNVGIHDNFFSLGGHSLVATQLISRLRLAFNVEIPLRTVFESPTVTQLDQTINQLRTLETGLTVPSIQPITKDREQLPLSWAQERLWFLHQLEGSTATYNIPAAMQITGELDLNALQQTLSEIVSRHQILRTSIQTVNGTPRQVIHPEATINIHLVDLQHLLPTERHSVQQQLAVTEAITPFNLDISPLIRCSLLQLSATEYVLLLTMHHIVSDGWSMGVLISELSTLYPAFCAGEPSPLPKLPIQYADFAVWQRQWLSGVVLDTQLNYWLSQLQGTPELLQLPTDRPRPSVQTYQGRTEGFTLNRNLTQKLQSLSGQSGTTLFMTLLAVFATLLYRYSAQSDILIGSPIANRNHSEIEPLIGFFVNTLVLRTNFAGNPSFESVLAQVRQTTLQAYEHQDVPFEQVVEALQPQRSLSHSPLFQVMFILQNVPLGEVELPGLTLSQLNRESTIAKFDLTLSMSETDQGLVGEWEYNTDLFDSSTIERMTGHFQNLLSAIVENPAVSVGEIPFLSVTERHQLLVEWNATESEYPTDKCIHQLFEEQVEKTPQAVALVFENQQLTYRELNHRANQLAHYLQNLGVGAEVLVGICLERSIEMVVGLLGILKAGGAYVPLDPHYPSARLSYMLTDSGVAVLLTQQQIVADLPKHDAVVVCLDTNWHLIAQQSDQNLITEVISNNLAYTIYTSGSTGKPKAVQILHSAVVNFLCTMRQHTGMTSDDVFLGVTTFTFDIAGLEIFLPIILGAYLVIAKSEVTVDGKQLLDLLVNSGTTIMQATPATWELLLEAGWQNSHQLKILCGGEALSRKLAKKLQAKSTSLWNVYGPTETTIWSLISQVDSQEGFICIGRPLANTEVYILDHHLQPVPIGVPGELYIGGDGLARGYLNRPELTQEKFIPNPLFEAKSQRLYKTGDLARYLPDGNIEYIGRIDQQVKIRGFRIELGEIEAVLNSHPYIQQAVVIATEDIKSNKRLVAYVIPSDQSLTINELRAFLKQKLPEYMVPSAFVTLESLPLTPNGKIDRKALPTPDSIINRESEYIAPRTIIELQLTQIWSSVLNITSVGVLDNFFEIGGHSLLAVRLMSQIQQHFQINLPLATLFQSPTIKQLAHLLSSSTNSLPLSALVPIKSYGNQPPLFCIHPAGGNVLCYHHLAYYLNSEQPLYGLQDIGLNPQNQGYTTIEQMATHYIQELQTVQSHGPYFLSGWSLGGLIAFEIAQQLSLQGEQIALLALLDTDPSSITTQEPVDDAALLVNMFRNDLNLCLEKLRQFEPEAQLVYVLEQAKEKNLFPEDLDIAQARHFLKIYKLNGQALKNYKPQYYSSSIVLFKASKTDTDIECAWNKLVKHKETYVVPGNHQNMLMPPHVQILAQKLQKSLEQAQIN